MEVAGGRDSGWISLYLKSMLLSEVLATSSAAPSAKSLQSCPTLWDPRDDSPPGSPIPGVLQARTLEWIAIAFSNAGKWKVKVKLLNHVWLLATPWTAACQAPSSMGFPRQEYWSGFPLPSLLATSRNWLTLLGSARVSRVKQDSRVSKTQYVENQNTENKRHGLYNIDSISSWLNRCPY